MKDIRYSKGLPVTTTVSVFLSLSIIMNGYEWRRWLRKDRTMIDIDGVIILDNENKTRQ